MSLLSKHKEMESELAAARERLQQQATELVLKASRWFVCVYIYIYIYWIYMTETQQRTNFHSHLENPHSTLSIWWQSAIGPNYHTSIQ